MASFRGSPCKTPFCGGHLAGFRYASGGGAQFTRSSTSFNNGMMIAMGSFIAPQPVIKSTPVRKPRVKR